MQTIKNRNLLSPALSAGKTRKSLLVLILHPTGWEGSAVFLQRAISNAFSCREVYLALHMASCWVKHVTSHFVCFIIKFQALRKFSSHKTWSLTLEGATPPVFSTPTEPLLNNSLGRREIWNWKIILFSCCYSCLLERFSFECWKKFNNNVGFVFLHFMFSQKFHAMFSANRKQNKKHELSRAQRRLHEFTLSSHWSTWRSILYLSHSFTTLMKKR